MDFVATILIALFQSVLDCDGASLKEQLDHINARRMESLGYPIMEGYRRLISFHPGEGSVILGAPSMPSHLPEAEAILPGHTLIRPALGMLKSSVKFPHRDLEGAAGVYGNINSLGITWGGTSERVLYTGFRKMFSNGTGLPPTNGKILLIILTGKSDADDNKLKPTRRGKLKKNRRKRKKRRKPRRQKFTGSNKHSWSGRKKKRESMWEKYPSENYRFQKLKKAKQNRNKYKDPSSFWFDTITPKKKKKSSKSRNIKRKRKESKKEKVGSSKSVNNKNANGKDARIVGYWFNHWGDWKRKNKFNDLKKISQLVGDSKHVINLKDVNGEKISQLLGDAEHIDMKNVNGKKARIVGYWFNHWGDWRRKPGSNGERNHLNFDGLSKAGQELRRQDMPTSHEHDFDSSIEIQELNPYPKEKDPHPRLTWFLNSKDLFNHIKISPEAPDFNELMPVAPKDYDETQWFFYPYPDELSE